MAPSIPRFGAALVVASAVVLFARSANAHAFAERYDLPLPLWFYLVGAGTAVALSFLIVALFVGGAHGVGPYPRLDLLRFRLGRAIASDTVVFAVRAFSVALFALILAAGFFGNQDNAFDNIVPTMIWVIWWVGFAFVSALVGDLWSLVNPWKSISIWLEALIRRRDPAAARSRGIVLPEALGAWPAVVLFLVFAWAELVWPSRGNPSSIAALIVVYSAITWLGMYLFGREEWLRRGEAFTAIYGLFARFAPLEGRLEGAGGSGAREWKLRPYAVGLLTDKAVPLSVMAFALLILSTVTIDGMIETPLWLGFTRRIFEDPNLRPIISALGDSQSVILSVGLVVLPVLFFGVYAIFVQLMSLAVAGRAGRGSAQPDSGSERVLVASIGLGERPSVLGLARLFIFSLVPIAIAYHLAHFLSVLLVFGQLIIPLASDPFGLGWDLFGTTEYQVNIGIVGARFVWLSSVVAIVIGHVAGVYVAHVMAIRAFADRQMATLSQYPMLVLMVGYTMTSLWILSQPIVEG